MADDVQIPTDTLLRMALISENHLKGEYEYLRVMVSAHEKELAFLSLGLVLMAIVNYALLVKLYKVERIESNATE